MTQTYESIEQVLDFAIARESQAHAFYQDLAETMEDPAMKQALLDFAQEELNHKAKLESIKQGDFGILDGVLAIPKLAIEESLQPIEPSVTMDYKAALTLAMKREKAAYLLYLKLASEAKTQELAILFLGLAHQEASHKLRFEVEYDEVVLKEN